MFGHCNPGTLLQSLYADLDGTLKSRKLVS
jgi:hypothetical protein